MLPMLWSPPAEPTSFCFVKKLFLAVLGLRCCTQAFFSCSERGTLVAMHGLLVVVVSLVAEHRRWGVQAS